eukprot:CAMPEP_0117030956 /NCGR_PEP_ID=MMETSP0472-20121206/22304_1 /TAXON_ID=693140 ORGANISM="Tiarina fusus, Strain LIS" /NCGR_SAMPLE_ID=MMETSP0472 /ASSEMBLY_ACC=CAM_ASM_000603 /LENGTH=299 /DNA_ID=CAMNT_0004739179 /DNA_START=88 /DNA_END=987 /DNA_ORIENTATION=+
MDASEAASETTKSRNANHRIIWILAGLAAVLVPFGVRTALVNNYQSKAEERSVSAYMAYSRSMGTQYYDSNKCQTTNKKKYFWQKECIPHYVDASGTYVSPQEIQQQMWEEQQEAMNAQYEYQQQQYEEGQNNAAGGYYNQGQYQGQYQGQQYQGQNMQYMNQQYPQYGNQGMNTSVKDKAPWLKALYALQIVAFVGILAHGWKVLSKSKDASRLSDMIAAFLAFSFVTVIWLRALTIETEDWDTAQTGYYGQFSVLLFMTNIAYIVFALPAAYFFRRKYVSAEAPAEDYVEASEGSVV